MKISEIINIEYQLYRDTRSDPVDVRRRDRDIGKEYTGSEENRPSLFRFWLKKLESGSRFPGQSFSSALTFLRYLVFFFFLISGATTCAGVLAYDGSMPVNIVNFIAVFVGIEVLLYLLFLINVLPGSIHNKVPLIGDFYRFAGFVFSRIIGTVSNHLYKNKTGSMGQFTAVYNRVKSRHTIYQKIERWTLFSITQLGGFAFSLGALAACAYLITFSDLAFAWNTTLDVTPDFFHKIVTLISAPWAFISKDLVPGMDLVEATRYFRLGGAYSGTHSSALLVGGWWPFLICILIFYGLIPRFILLVLSRFVLLRTQKKAPFLSSEFDSLHRRLISPIFSIRTESIENGEKKSENKLPVNPESSHFKAEACFLIIWGEIDLSETEIEEIVRAGFKWNIVETYYAGMLDNLKDVETLGRFEGSSRDEPVILVAESWEAPGKAVEHFLRILRNNINRDRRIIIGLINRNSESHLVSPQLTDWQNWQNSVTSLNDPFISIEPITEEL